MKNEKLLSHIGDIDAKFVEEAEKAVQAKETNALKLKPEPMKKLSFRPIPALAIAAALMLFIAGVMPGNSGDFSGFTILAYAAEDESQFLTQDFLDQTDPMELKPNVEIMLPKYSPIMNSVPGFPFTFDVADEHVNMRLDIEGGTLLIWDADTFLLDEFVSGSVCEKGMTLYWAPYSYENDSISEHARITITALDGEKEIAEQVIAIDLVDDFYRARIEDLK